METPDRGCIIVFVKAPEKGRVKSRLARDLDDEFVLRLYESMVLDTLDTLKNSSFPFRICYSPPEAHDRMQAWLGREYTYMPQTGEDLGERMERAFKQVFAETGRRVVLVGSDIPGLSPDILAEAFASLDTNDAVIGPANDGGYYLIGFNREGFEPAVFHDILWSTDTVFQETAARMETRSRKVHVLPRCSDADRKEDLKALLAREQEHTMSVSRTLALLRMHKTNILS